MYNSVTVKNLLHSGRKKQQGLIKSSIQSKYCCVIGVLVCKYLTLFRRTQEINVK